jgi:Mn-dependent DtxR family transcriptional regulator
VVVSASCKWVAVRDIARRLELSEEIVGEAVRRAAEQGWLEVTEDWPPRVRLHADLLAQL